MMMPRTERKIGKTGIYHVLIRGIDRQRIFEDDEDYRLFLHCLKYTQDYARFKVFAYCLMPNHVHMLIKVTDEPLSQIMRRLGAKYVRWFNNKYDRVGYLFQGRYKSEPIDDDKYFLTVWAYIYQNPVKAGLCARAVDYAWSGISRQGENFGLIDKAGVSEIADTKALNTAVESLVEANILDNATGRRRVYMDKEVIEIVKKLCGITTTVGLQSLQREAQSEIVAELRRRRVPIRQIARLMGLSKGMVEKVGLNESRH
jgi:REP element-mobilizing transposase RayT